MWAHLTVVALVALDQLTKALVQHRFLDGEHVAIVPGLFNLRYVRNTGAAWGMLAGWRALLVLFSVGMLLLIVRYRRHFAANGRLSRVALPLMVAGIVGNLVDRVRLGYVVDFLDFYLGTSHFPTFNLADSAICVGVGLYLLAQFLERAPADAAAAVPATATAAAPEGAATEGAGNGDAAA